MSVTIKDLSRLARVSATTVSRVLNGKSYGFSAETREKILKIAHDCDYRPNAVARGLVTRRTGNIGLILPDITNPFFPSLARGAEDFAMANGYNVFLCNSDENAEKEEAYFHALLAQCIDGIILSKAPGGTGEVGKSGSEFPVVFVDREEAEGVPCMLFNNRGGGYLVGRHLAGLGHTAVACITGRRTLGSDTERVEGFRRAFGEKGILIPDENLFECNYQMEAAEQIAETVLRDRRFTAVFATNDLMAAGVCEAARRLGISIPGQLSVAGFDDIYLSRCVTPKLTTVRQPGYQMGYRASEALIDMIRKQNRVEHAVVFQPELIVRESTAPPRV